MCNGGVGCPFRNGKIRAASGQEVWLTSQSEDVLRNMPFSVLKKTANEDFKSFQWFKLTDLKKTIPNCMHN